MTRNEVIMMLEVLRKAYPKTFGNLDDMAGTIDFYYNRFKEYPSDLVVQALDLYVDENEYPPTVAGIKKYITLIQGSDDYEQMFNELWMAICGAKKFTELCPQNKRYIQSQKALDDLGQSESTLKDVVHGQYLKRIGTICDEMRAQRVARNQLGQNRLDELQGVVKQITG